MDEQPQQRVMVFIDGANFLHAIRNLFYFEFDRRDYLPQNAAWSWFFGKIAEELRATEFSVRWYVIGELDYLPHLDWETVPWEELERKVKLEELHEELTRKTTEKGRRTVVERYRKLCQDAEQRMKNRLVAWRTTQDAISQAHPFVRFVRPGWQSCRLPGCNLGREKGIDIGLAVDLVMNQDHYDLAVLFSGDGDYVPAIKVIQQAGKRFALMEFEFRTGKALRGTARRLRDLADIVIEVPFADLSRFLGIQAD